MSLFGDRWQFRQRSEEGGGAPLLPRQPRRLRHRPHGKRRHFFSWAAQESIAIQHILYDRADLDTFIRVTLRETTTHALRPRLLFVLGLYAQGQESRPEDLGPFLAGLKHHGLEGEAIWSVCAFGRGETAALVAALQRGGHIRVGFENSFWSSDGAVARDNAARVAVIAKIARESARPLASPEQARAILCGT